MAAGIGLTLDTSFLINLRKADQHIKDLTDNTNRLSKITIDAFQQMAQKGVTPYVEQLIKQKKAFEEIGKIKGSGHVLTQMKNDAKAVVDELNNVIKALQKTKAYKGEQSGKTAISFANSVLGQRGEPKSINNMRLAIRQLEDAQNRLNLNTKTGQKNYEKIAQTIAKVKNELNKVTGESKKVNNEARKMGNSISYAFALNAVRTFTKQLVDVRGEFELQHRSLQVLIQDVDKANELWDKTVALAVKSPFRVKDLVTYTKQLAAYRVEADKLYDTTRMLADVSSGLGVDMNRLILAFGQVKAANFLRGTELRQFSEAGVNLLEELSKRFTALEGRAVSVGDVFERVSKRMVSFKDVEAVFETITSEGGVFYQMQEKQSETLKGMMMNLQDSIDLMFNDIGSKNQSIIKGVVKLIKEMVDNWRKVAPVIEGAGVALTVHFSVNRFVKLGRAISAALTANPWLTVTSLALGLGVAIYKAVTSTNELKAAMDGVDTEITRQLEESIALYHKLADRVRDVTLSEKEREKAMVQLKSRFDEILPDQLLELEYIKGISDNYDEATNAMINYYNAKAIEQKKDRIDSQYAEELEGTDIPELITSTRAVIDKLANKGEITEQMRVRLLAGVTSAVNSVVEDVKSGKLQVQNIGGAIWGNLDEFANMQNRLYAKVQTNPSLALLGFNEQVFDLATTLAEIKTAYDTYVNGLPSGNAAQIEAANLFLPEKENIEAAKKVFQEVASIFDGYANSVKEVDWKAVDKEVKDMLKGLPQEAKEYVPALKAAFALMASKAKEGAFEFRAALQGVKQGFTLDLSDVIGGKANFLGPIQEDTKEALVNLVDNMQETLDKEGKRLDLTKFQTSVTEAMRVIAKETGVSVNEFKDYIPQMGDTISKTREEVASKISLLEGDIKHWKESLEANNGNLGPLRADTLGATPESIEAMEKVLGAFKLLRTFLGDAEKGKKQGDDIQERIKVVDQMNAKYKELNKTLSKGEALEGAFKAYKDAFATAYEREDVRTMTPEQFANNVLNFPDEDAIIAWLKNLASTVKDAEDKFKVQMAQGKFEMDIKVRDKKELDDELEKDIQDMFDQYELSLELKKLNISPDLAKSLFGIESLDLSAIRSKIESELTAAQAVEGNEDRIKQLKKDLEKVNDMEDKAQIERLKTYLEYTRAAIGERAKIKVEEMRKLQEIDETFNKAAAEAKTEEDKKRIEEQRRLAKEGVKKEATEDTLKKDWEDFKTSETFMSVFQDLENASDDLLNHAIGKIREFQEQWKDMPIADAKEMINKLHELELALLDTGKPFADYRKANREIENAMLARNIKPNAKNGMRQEELRSKLGAENKEMEEMIAKAQVIESVLQTINNATGENKQAQLESIGINEKYVESLGLSKEVLTNSVKANQEIVDSEKDKAAQAARNVSQNNKVLKQLNTQQKRLQQQAEALGNAKKMANDLYDSFKGLTEALGGGDSPAMIFADMGMSMANTVLDTIMLQIQLNAATIAANGLGAAMNAAMGVIGWIVMAIQLLVQGITAAVNYADKLRQMKLDILAGQVDNLKQKYDDLAQSIEDAYSTEQLERFSKELEVVHKKMEEAQENYIKLLEEGDKANRIDIAKEAQALLDSGKTVAELTNRQRKALLSEEYKDYKEASDALLEMQKDHEEEKKEILASMGGVSDYKNAAQDFVDAWVDAFQETGEGLSGLQENFREFFDDVIKQEAMRRVTDKYMQPFFDDLNNALESGSSLSAQEIANLKEKADRVAPELNRVLEELWKALGGSMGEVEASGLTALQKGIQGVTEETAQVIEAYLNSVRAYVATISADTTSQLNEVKAMHRLLESVTLGGHTKGGVGFKVFVD